MAPLPSRKSLEAMKRVDLQKLCKDYGVKANLKTEALIDLLLDTSTPAPKPPAPQPTRRSVSTRISSRAGPGRVSSVIIHDTDDEEEDEEDHQEESDEQETENQPEPEPAPAPQTRTRKAKDTQTRLGVGRPVAAGGAGPRAVTKSLSISKGKRGRPSKNMKLTEATIPEEPEPEAPTEPAQEPGPSSTKDESDQSKHEPGRPQKSTDSSLASLADIDKHVADALRPLHEQMQSLKSEIEQMQYLKAELTQLKTQMADMGTLQQKVDNLTAEVEGLRSQVATATALGAEVKELRGSVAATNSRQAAAEPARRANPTTPHFKSPAAKKTSGPAGFGNPPSGKAAVPSSSATDINASGSNSSGSQTVHGTSTTNPTLPHPGIAPNMLGKRRRDSTASNVTGVVEEGQEGEFSEEELAKRVIRPTKKRAKIVSEGEELSQEESSAAQHRRSAEEEEEEEELQPGPPIPSFTVFSGDEQQEFLDPPPPTTHLPDFFAPPSPSGSGSSRHAATTSTAHASENQHPFSFSFLPLSSTPAHSMYPLTMPSFPYPEPPQSPSPAGSHQNAGGFLGHHDGERTDIFQSFGLPPPGRPRTGAALGASGSGSGSQDSMGGMGAFVNPAALTRPVSDREREVSSNDVAAGLGLTAVRTASSSTDSGSATGSDAPPIKRTMYGTELDGDTRFGDFGVEGVATGFWAGGRF